MDWLTNYLFSDGGYSPHGFCIAWDPTVLYTHIAADLLIALSYFAIPAIMLVFLRHRRDSRLHGPAMLFVIFIAACGISHIMSVVTMYTPWYGLQGVIKLFTGVVSFITALALWKMLPDALRIPAPEDLMQAIAEKDAEIAQRRETEAQNRRAQTALAKKVEELEAANAELREFAYAASHDLKSPANTLSLWLDEFLKECEGKLSPDLLDEIADAQRLIGGMRQLVEDILSYARIVSHDLSEPAPCDLDTLLAATLEGFRGEIVETGAEIVAGELGEVDGYAPMLSILLHNLIGNALKFRDPDRPPRIEVETRRARDNVTLIVRDNGIGIPPAQRERVFKLFKRLHHPTRYEGTGLGLSLCRRVAAMHGGTIAAVDPPEGPGTELRVTLPQEETNAKIAA